MTKTGLDRTRLVEEVPGVPKDEQFYLWHERKVVAHFHTREAGEAYAQEHGIVIDCFEPFEP